MDGIKRVNQVLDEAMDRLAETSDFETPASGDETPYPYGPLGGQDVPGPGGQLEPEGNLDDLNRDDLGDLDDFDLDELGPQVAAFDEYIGQVIDNLVMNLGVGDEEAWEILLDFADMLSGDNALPNFPGESEDGEDLTKWMAAAKSIGFNDLVLKFGEGETVEVGATFDTDGEEE